ncbi:MAG: glycosyltransferase family 39 protein [Candidatus Bathyarchaeia archaeon]
MERTFIKAGELMFKAKTFLIKNWILVITLVIATFLRLWNIDQVGFNGDEAVYAGQAATLAGYREYANHFSLVRAHPLLFQFFVSIIYRFTISDVAARVISAVFGVLTVYLVHELGGILFDKRVGLLASIFMSLLPYHVIVSRQALLEPTLTFFFTLTIWLFWKYQLKRSAMLAYLVGVSSALTFLSKEVGILVVGIILFLLLFGYCNFLKNTCSLHPAHF